MLSTTQRKQKVEEYRVQSLQSLTKWKDKVILADPVKWVNE